MRNEQFSAFDLVILSILNLYWWPLDEPYEENQLCQYQLIGLLIGSYSTIYEVQNLERLDWHIDKVKVNFSLIHSTHQRLSILRIDYLQMSSEG
ncbi:hypothetical protein CKAN_01888100 [Cinnamomum micranthum f. kanehirae]|uniref:Uncharacterized protein n=1 Tax=Cinnamomum micranthum f. kanehirae TaxID=337451 RepID=A0A3S3MU42_9MAGN|nr:hypothetical protein CKAN_01888100 [Cinnamomum micranthum f. kanehirae]